ncbi:ligand-binding SRPBCC domain-containing protein [Flavobacterium sp. 7E]|uniref:SRPBCC family protein n=1 Tax=Flavobacterium sp. 7E TaxID=2735898 RepID=UPI00156E31BF|nr:SRPBCC family protein [Flavobacterium sp. 7E]NRS89613.1 ligand-binding SRPBCC domain-containing protein [Flavobacterium sp. 7E]
MTTIQLSTVIKAPIQIVFDYSRNIDTHQQSANKTSEVAIAGKTKGLINKGETVTWRGKHFGLYLQHQSIISQMELHTYFVDEQLKGHFKSFKHQHFFEEKNGVTIMKDVMEYATPFGILGTCFDLLFLKKHLNNFLIQRNNYLKLQSEQKSLQTSHFKLI